MLEGIDGCGKSTQAEKLARALGALLTAEPGATALGADLRALLLDPQKSSVSLRSEALLMAADRAEHVARGARASARRRETGSCATASQRRRSPTRATGEGWISQSCEPVVALRRTRRRA